MINSGIYKITHIDSNREYIGQSINLKNRFNSYRKSGGSGNGDTVIKRAIKKYGWGSFKWDVLLYANDVDYLNLMEIKIIAAYKSQVPNGFNVAIGGLNSPLSDDTKAKLSLAHKGKVISDEIKEKIKITQSNIWKNKTDQEKEKVISFLRNVNLGKERTEENKQKISKTRCEKFSKGELSPVLGFKGKKHTEETKAKMRAARLGRKHTEEDKEKMSIIALKKWENADFRNKVIAAKRKK